MIGAEFSARENRQIIFKKSLKPKTSSLRIHQSDWSKKRGEETDYQYQEWKEDDAIKSIDTKKTIRESYE